MPSIAVQTEKLKGWALPSFREAQIRYYQKNKDKMKIRNHNYYFYNKVKKFIES